MSFAQRTIRKKIPFYVFWELTRRCNLHCKHCYIVREPRVELSLSEIRVILRQLKKMQTLILNFSGGEVLTRKDFLMILYYAKKAGFAFKFFTNGTLLNRSIVKEIARLKPLRIEITVFSTRASIHDAITGVPGALQRTLRALELLKRYGIAVRIKTPLMRDNVSGYKRVIQLAQHMGMAYQLDPTLIPRLDGNREPLRSRINKRQLSAVLSDPKVSLAEDFIDETMQLAPSRLPCSCGHNSCAFTAYGDVYPCIILPVLAGNLRQHSFPWIWKHSRFLKKWRSYTLKDLPECSVCPLLRWCKRCPGLAYLEEGDYLSKSQRACLVADVLSALRPSGTLA